MTRDVAEINEDGENAWNWGGAPFCYINEANIKEDNKGTKCDIMKGLVSSAQGNVIIKLTANELRLTQCHACGSTHPAHNLQLSRHLNCSRVQQATRRHLASRFRTIVFCSQLRSARVKLRFPSTPWSPSRLLLKAVHLHVILGFCLVSPDTRYLQLG